MLLDRAGEKEALAGLLAAVREGLSGAVVLRGEAGIGKTALLEYAMASAEDLQVVRVVGVESEMDLGFAGLHQLLIPFMSGLERLPAPQRQALGSALGLVSGGAADLFLVSLATLTLLANAAAEQPVLCVFDDAQWLDQASARALGFVARRLFADGIAMLFAIREPTEPIVAFEGLTDLHLGGLPDGDARELLASVAGGRLEERVGDRILSETRGNPLALIELGGELTPGQLSGSLRLQEPLPMGGRLEERFLGRVHTLPAEPQMLLLVAAADPSGDPALLWRAAELLGLGVEDASRPELDRLLRLDPRVAFRHPLIRSAVYQGASSHARRAAHEALAAASDPELDADRRAWHLGAASVGPDEEVAAELERSADRARDRGGWASGAAFLERSAELTADDHARAPRRLAAAHANLMAGDPGRARILVERAMAQLDDPLDRAQARRLEGRIQLALGEPDEAPSILLEAARAFEPLDVRLTRQTLLSALEASLYARQFAHDGPLDVARAARA